MRFLQTIALAAFSLFGCQFVSAQEPVDRLVEFRDGSILQLKLPPDFVFDLRQADFSSPSGEIKSVKVGLDSVESIRFSRKPILLRLQKIQSAAAQLGDEKFHIRETAMRDLVKNGEGFRSHIEDLLKGSVDPEIRWRLGHTLTTLPPHTGIYEHAYDEMKTTKETLKGDIAAWSMEIDYRGSRVILDRGNVRSLRKPSPVATVGSTPVIATTDPIRKDLDALFPEGYTRIEFETDSNGVALREGQDISRRFISDGFIIETSAKDGIVSVNDYQVSSRSGGQSAATHLPLYEGTLTVTFCAPGDELEPAGVTHVGLYAAVVLPAGTTLAAIDGTGHRIASITTESGPHEFFGLRSNVPIHKIQIIPNIEIDPNFTIDDLVFDTPMPLHSGGDPENYSLEFSTGERVTCSEFKMEGDEIAVRPVNGFAKQLRFPRERLSLLRTPTAPGAPDLPLEKPFWVMLDDGSTLLATAGPKEDSSPNLLGSYPLTDFPISAAWAESSDLHPFPEDADLKEKQIVVIPTNETMIFTDPKFGPDKFTAVQDDSTSEWSYKRMPSVWITPPDPERSKKAAGFVRLNSGERIVLGNESTFRLKSFDAKTVTLTKGDKEFLISLESITTLRLPR